MITAPTFVLWFISVALMLFSAIFTVLNVERGKNPMIHISFLILAVVVNFMASHPSYFEKYIFFLLGR